MNFNSSIIIITAPMTPRDMFAHVTEDILQLTRRIDHVVHFPALIPDATAANLLAPMQDVPAPLAASFNPPRAPLMPLLNHGSNDENVPPSKALGLPFVIFLAHVWPLSHAKPVEMQMIDIARKTVSIVVLEPFDLVKVLVRT